MTQNATAPTTRLSLAQRLVLIQGLGWLSSLSVLNGAALAQDAPKEIVIPESTSAQPMAPAPVESAPLAPAPAPAAPESFAPEPSAPPAAETPAPQQPSVSLPAVPRSSVQFSSPPAAASSSYDAPTSIIFSERSSGCQAVSQSGRIPAGGLCAPAIPPAATGRTVPTVGGLSTVNVSSLSNSPGGLGIPTTPSARDYYNRTLRPPGQLGNGNIRLLFPLTIPAPITSMFGWRVHPITGETRLHAGTDIGAPMGTPIVAAYTGRVAIADFLSGYGLTVTLEHNKGTQETLYAHMSEIFVKPGEWVKQGTVIGRVGSTGFSTGPHLHFEFRQLTPDGWVAMDPGAQLEYALAQLVKALQIAKATSKGT